MLHLEDAKISKNLEGTTCHARGCAPAHGRLSLRSIAGPQAVSPQRHHPALPRISPYEQSAWSAPRYELHRTASLFFQTFFLITSIQHYVSFRREAHVSCGMRGQHGISVH